MRNPKAARRFRALLTAGLFVLVACGNGAKSGGTSDETGTSESDMKSRNGLTTNGLTTNGLTTNGLTTNGLTTNGLASAVFSTWFATNPLNNATTMKYLAKCAVPAGKSVNYWFAGTNYVWPGELGLAPTWSTNGSFPVSEQQLVSACMAAHVNKFGVHVTVSMRAYYPNGTSIPIASSEDASYDQDEGCFFGNLFDGTGVFSAYSSYSPMVYSGETSLRACALSDGRLGSCPPMVTTGRSCQQLCTGYTSAMNGDFQYTSCSWGGVNYKPISVRLNSNDIASCGDGYCDASETCWEPSTGRGCRADCGKCW